MGRIVTSIKCCVVTDRAADIRVAWLVYVRTHCVPIAFLKSITRFGRRPNNKNDDFYDLHELTL